ALSRGDAVCGAGAAPWRGVTCLPDVCSEVWRDRDGPRSGRSMSMSAHLPLTGWDPEQLHGAIDAGFLLPTQWYADPAIFQAELQAIHRRAWHFATHTGDLAESGDVYVRNIAGVPVLLTRAEDGEIRGFINICRHRG